MLVRFGNWIFHYRNFLFPLFYAALFIPSSVITNSFELTLISGMLFIITGMMTRSITIGLVYIKRGGVNRQIYADTLVNEGIYKICRNPMYLGNITLLFGFGLLSNSVIFMLVFFPLFCFFYTAIIKAEESFLATKFGIRYEEFRQDTNALLPDITKIKEAFAGHHFDFRKVIRNEYNSLFLYFLGVVSLLFYKKVISLSAFSVISVILIVIYLALKIQKKRGML
ncbi:MAG TPA: methyltransferase [Bacteroidales bacterium]|nr:methyltransferase [Bacteroidales bacterium]